MGFGCVQFLKFLPNPRNKQRYKYSSYIWILFKLWQEMFKLIDVEEKSINKRIEKVKSLFVQFIPGDVSVDVEQSFLVRIGRRLALWDWRLGTVRSSERGWISTARSPIRHSRCETVTFRSRPERRFAFPDVSICWSPEISKICFVIVGKEQCRKWSEFANF